MSTNLQAAAADRKARLAQLKSLKRKQAPTDDDRDTPSAPSTALTTSSTENPTSVAETYLSGRNFDFETRNAKLGFESIPIADPTQTLEYKAQQLALETKKKAQEEEKDAPLDLFKLQPKKPNWDLKRDLAEKMKVVDVWTENAIARLVRERVEAQKQSKKQQTKEIDSGEGSSAVEKGRNGKEGRDGGGDDMEKAEVGMEGQELVEAMHLREREAEEERERERREEREEAAAEAETEADAKAGDGDGS